MGDAHYTILSEFTHYSCTQMHMIGTLSGVYHRGHHERAERLNPWSVHKKN